MQNNVLKDSWNSLDILLTLLNHVSTYFKLHTHARALKFENPIFRLVSIFYWAWIFIKSALFLGGTTKSPFGPAQLKLGWIFQLTYGVGVTSSGMTWKRKNPVFAKAYIAKMIPKPCLSIWKWLSSIFKLVKQMEQLWVFESFTGFTIFLMPKKLQIVLWLTQLKLVPLS